MLLNYFCTGVHVTICFCLRLDPRRSRLLYSLLSKKRLLYSQRRWSINILCFSLRLSFNFNFCPFGLSFLWPIVLQSCRCRVACTSVFLFYGTWNEAPSTKKEKRTPIIIAFIAPSTLGQILPQFLLWQQGASMHLAHHCPKFIIGPPCTWRISK